MQRSTSAFIPALSQSSVLRYLTFSALYVAQGIPEGLIFFALPAWMAKHGLSPAEIGSFVGISLLPWSFKLINGPLMDRFSFLPMGRRRPWVLFGQLGLIVSFFLFSFVENPLENLMILTVLGFTVSFFGAFQDVATDGMAIDILPEDQQARANGLMWGSKTVGISTSVSLGSILLNSSGFSTTVLYFSGVVLLIILVPSFLREHPGEKFMPWTAGKPSETSLAIQLTDWKSIFQNLIRVFFLPMSLIMGIAVFSVSIGRGFIDTILPVMTVQELGWTDSDYSQIFATSKLVSGIAGMFIGGALIDFLGKKRMITVFLSLLILLVLALSILSFMWDQPAYVTAFIITFYILEVFLTIAIFATAMQLCWKKVAATQFTLYMAIANLGLSVGAALLGPLTSFFTYKYALLSYILFASGMLILIQFVNLQKHKSQIELLDE